MINKSGLLISDPAPIPKEVMDSIVKPFEPSELKMPENMEFNFSDYQKKMLTCVEMEDEFIFEHLVKYVNDELYTPEDQIRIPKRLLIRAIECFRKEHEEEWEVLMKGEEK